MGKHGLMEAARHAQVNGFARAIFLDRDGVINRPVVRDGKPYPPGSLEEFEMYPEAGPACAAMKDAGYLLIVVTNQPDVGRGTQSQAVVEDMHAALCRALPIDRVEVCYDPGQGENSAFHKPAPGMVLRAARELHIDLPGSFLVGDRWRDIDCGTAAGCQTIFIDRGYNERLRCQAHYTVSNLLEAVQVILANQSPQGMR
jgi:D-glycero-D-manno-heptose 1,7-bisphosphate phosphatase